MLTSAVALVGEQLKKKTPVMAPVMAFDRAIKNDLELLPYTRRAARVTDVIGAVCQRVRRKGDNRIEQNSQGRKPIQNIR